MKKTFSMRHLFGCLLVAVLGNLPAYSQDWNATGTPLKFPNTFATRKIVFFETFPGATGPKWVGFGTDSGALRYQTSSWFNDHVFYAAYDAATNKELLRIKGSGNVGIGVNPNAPLQFAAATANRKIVLYESVNNEHQFYGLGVNANTLRYQTDKAESDHVFYSGVSAGSSKELFRIKGNGNIGIGVEDPLAPLQFANVDQNKKIVLGTITADDHQFFGLGNNSSTMRYQTDKSTSDHVFYSGINNTSSKELFRIKGNGNIGIGMANPNAPLQFPATMAKRKIVLYEYVNNDNQFYGLGVDSSAMRYQTAATFADHVFYAASNASTSKELMRIKGNGFVGIGTANPTKGKLQVVGSFHVENEDGKQTFHVSAGRQLVFVGDSAWIQYNATLGNVNSPIQKDHFSMWVSKGIVTQDLAIVNPNQWADFVFEKKYKLRTLEAVAAYIAANGHLPEMPSEAEVKANGYSVHEINKKLLQKIEELTLYAIGQQNKLATQSAQLQAQQQQFANLEQRIKQLENNK